MSVENAEPKRPTCAVCQDFDRFGVVAAARIMGSCSHRTRTMWVCQEHLDAALTNRVLCFDTTPPEAVTWTDIEAVR